jgi:Protein of unknown function (DUF1524)
MVESDSIRTEPPSATRGGGWHPPARSIAPGVPPGAPGHYWGDDPTVSDSLTTALNFYLQGRGPQRTFILQALNDHALVKGQLKREHVGRQWPKDITVEHIMPQTLSRPWRAAISNGLPPRSRTPAEVGATHEQLLHRLGNLTLMRAKTQPRLANKPFREKVKIIEEDLQIRLNSDLLKYSGWGPREIQGRGAELAKLACAIWSPPDADSQNP